MESNNVPKGFEKFKIFRDLITDIALLIKNLEQNLKIKLNQNKPSNSSLKDNLAKSTLGSRIKKIWPFRGVFEAHRASLSDYLEYNNNINKFLDEIVLESTGRVNLIEQYDQIADIINKFKIDASGIFRKYSQQLQPEYDRERENFIKNTGIPDPVSDREIEDAHKSRSDNPRDFAYEPSSEEAQDESVGLLISKLIEHDTDIDNKDLVKKVLGDDFNEDIWNKIKNYDILDAIKLYSPKIIKPEIIKIEEGGKVKKVVSNWTELFNKYKEELSKDWPIAAGKDPGELEKKLSMKKTNQMSAVEKLQYSLLIYEDSDEFHIFMDPIIAIK